MDWEHTLTWPIIQLQSRRDPVWTCTVEVNETKPWWRVLSWSFHTYVSYQNSYNTFTSRVSELSFTSAEGGDGGTTAARQLVTEGPLFEMVSRHPLARNHLLFLTWRWDVFQQCLSCWEQKRADWNARETTGRQIRCRTFIQNEPQENRITEQQDQANTTEQQEVGRGTKKKKTGPKYKPS